MDVTDDIDEDDQYLIDFMYKLQDKSYTDIEAVQAVRLYIKAGEVIPVELYPYIDTTCDVWQKSPGVARQTKKADTATNRSNRVWSIRILKRMYPGLSITNAAKIVAKSEGIAFSKLATNYRTSLFEDEKADADFLYLNSDWDYS